MSSKAKPKVRLIVKEPPATYVHYAKYPKNSAPADMRGAFRSLGTTAVYARKAKTAAKTYIPKGTFSTIGTAVGGGLGAIYGAPAIGAGLGRTAGSAFANLVGFGDYRVSKNSLYESNGPPMVKNKGKTFVISHREFLGNVYSGAGTANGVSPFTVQGFNINPGLKSTFPWMWPTAGLYEQYRIDGMVFEYKSMYSDAVVTQNGAIGTVVLATDYNAGGPLFTSKQQMENYEFSMSMKPSQSCLHPIECARRQTPLSELYVRAGPVPSGEDIKTYDLGVFQIASEGIPLGSAGAQVLLGELWVTYEISLFKPQLLYSDSGYAHLSGTNGVLPLTANFLNPVKYTSSNIGAVAGGNIIEIPLLGYSVVYMIVIRWYMVGGVNTNGNWSPPTIASTTGGAGYNAVWGGSTFGYPTGLTSTAVNGCVGIYFLTANAATASTQVMTVTFNLATLPSTSTVACNWDVIINALPTGAN